MLSTLDVFIVIVYFLVILFIGWKMQKTENQESFLIGNRKVKTASLNATISASLTGGAALAAYIAFLYLWGISAFWIFIGAAIGILSFIPFALKVKKEGDKKKHYTMLDFLYSRFGKTNITIAAALLIVMFLTIIISEMVITGKVFSLITGMPYWSGIVIATMVTLFYVLSGGVRSDIKTDVFQYIMFAFFVIIGIGMVKGTTIPVSELHFFALGITKIIGLILMGIFIIFVSADVWQKAYAAQNAKAIKKGFVYAAISYLLIGIAISVIGLAIKTHFPSVDANNALIYGFSTLPTGLLGLGIVALLSATMSTIDTALVVGSLFVSRDIVSHYRTVSIAKLIKSTKLFMIVLCVISAVIALFTTNLVSIIYNMFNFALILAPAVTASFFWKIKKRAVFWSLTMGIITAAGLLSLGKVTADATIIPFIVSLIVLAIGQFCFKK